MPAEEKSTGDRGQTSGAAVSHCSRVDNKTCGYNQTSNGLSGQAKESAMFCSNRSMEKKQQQMKIKGTKMLDVWQTVTLCLAILNRPILVTEGAVCLSQGCQC